MIAAMTYDEDIALAISTALKRKGQLIRALAREKNPEYRDRNFMSLANAAVKALRLSQLLPDDDPRVSRWRDK